jgi:hypothetical protein
MKGIQHMLHSSHDLEKQIHITLTGYPGLIEMESIMAWSVILSVHGADPMAAVKLLKSPFLR